MEIQTKFNIGDKVLALRADTIVRLEVLEVSYMKGVVGYWLIGPDILKEDPVYREEHKVYSNLEELCKVFNHIEIAVGYKIPTVVSKVLNSTDVQPVKNDVYGPLDGPEDSNSPIPLVIPHMPEYWGWSPLNNLKGSVKFIRHTDLGKFKITEGDGHYNLYFEKQKLNNIPIAYWDDAEGIVELYLQNHKKE